MRNTEINIELLLGRPVLTLSNNRAGRIEEIRAELREGDCYVTEYLIGAYAVFERLSALAIGRAVLDIFGSRFKSSYRVPWDRLDLSNPQRPRLRCRVSQLRRIS